MVVTFQAVRVMVRWGDVVGVVVSGGGVTGMLVVVESVACRRRKAAGEATLEPLLVEGLGGGLARVVGGIRVRVDRGVDDANTVRVQLTSERVVVVLVHALTVKVRWTVTVVGRGVAGRAEEVALSVVVLVAVTVVVVVSSWGSRAICSMIF